MKRQIIRIDEDKCNGCGLCIPNCQEGALQIIDGKARLISDLFCDGLGACIGHCPEGAIELEEREAEPYNEIKVMEILAGKGKNTILAHLEHLRDHNETGYLNEAIRYIRENQIEMSEGITGKQEENQVFQGCPGVKTMDLRTRTIEKENGFSSTSETKEAASELRQWPVQLHLLNPQASYFKNADVVLAADCVAFSMGNFHSKYLKEKSLAIACPKLDSNKESYIEKLTAMIRDSKIKTLTVIIMEVPCCGGLLHMAKLAREAAEVTIPIKKAMISIKGEIMDEQWV